LASLALADFQRIRRHFHAAAAPRLHHTEAFEFLVCLGDGVWVNRQLPAQIAHTGNQRTHFQPAGRDVENDLRDDLLEDRDLGFRVDVKPHESPRPQVSHTYSTLEQLDGDCKTISRVESGRRQSLVYPFGARPNNRSRAATTIPLAERMFPNVRRRAEPRRI